MGKAGFARLFPFYAVQIIFARQALIAALRKIALAAAKISYQQSAKGEKQQNKKPPAITGGFFDFTEEGRLPLAVKHNNGIGKQFFCYRQMPCRHSAVPFLCFKKVFQSSSNIFIS